LCVPEHIKSGFAISTWEESMGRNLLEQGDNVFHPGFTLPGTGSLAITFDDTGNMGNILDFLVLSGTTSVSIASTGAIGGANFLFQLLETNNDPAVVTIKGSESFVIGQTSISSNVGDGVVTDIAATAKSPTTIHSSLKLIDASATTGELQIFAGATNTSGAGLFVDGGSLNANISIKYTGLTIKGGSGQDFIENDAKNGVVTAGNGDDTVILGGAGAKAILGSGTGDNVQVGQSLLGNNEPAGSALGDSVKFGSAPTATLSIYTGAEAGSTAGTTSIGLTKVLKATALMNIDFSAIAGSSNIFDEDAAVAGSNSLKTAENEAVGALSGAGVAYFNFRGNEYFIATNNTETTVSSQDAIVKLVGVTGLHAIDSSGLVTLHA
jgi:hypothetical protein